MKARIPTLLVGSILCACLTSDPALGRERIDLVLLHDVSGSMRKTDPQNHSTEAVRLLIGLLDGRDRLAMLNFDQKVRALSGFVQLREEEKSRLQSLILKQGRPSGAYTNLHAALAAGLERLQADRRGDARPLAVLFTDGQMDVGAKSEDERLVSEVKNQLIPLYRSLGITLYTVAFSDGADFDFLREIAQQTGGFGIRVDAPEDLPKIFARIFELAKEPEMVPIEGGSIQVDDNVSELTVLIDGPAAGRLSLVSPDDRSFLASDETRHIAWLEQPSYSMISIAKPQPGRWLIKGESTDKRAYVLTNIALEARLVDAPQPNGGKRLEAWLEKDEKRLEDRRVLEVAEFTAEIAPIEKPGEPLQMLRLHDDGADGDVTAGDGVYSGPLGPLAAGQFQVEVGADAKAFKRSKNLFVEGVAPPTEADPRPEDAAGESDGNIEKAPEAVPPQTPHETHDEGPIIARVEGRFSDALKILAVVNIFVLGLGALSFAGFRRYKSIIANKERKVPL